MDEDKASRFISSLVKSIQALCNGFVDFSTSIEVIGHIHLNIDRNVKLDYVLTEEVSKSASEGSTVFASHSYHSQGPSSVNSKNTDTSNHGQKSHKDNEADPLGLSALPREVPNTSKSDSSQSSNRVGDNRNSSSGSVGFSRNSDSESLRHDRSSFQAEDSSVNKRRKIGPFSQSTPHPAAKRNRPNDFGSGSRTVVKEPGFEVIEIKEEPDEDVPAVFFGGSSSGQDIQTPDFSNVVMESLDRVSQLEQNTDLVGDGGSEGMGEYKQPVFPVMFHQGDGMSTSSAGGRVPGPSSDSQAMASTSGGVGSGEQYVKKEENMSNELASSSSSKEEEDTAPLQPPGYVTPTGQRVANTTSWTMDRIPTWKSRGRYKKYSDSDLLLAVQLVKAGNTVKKAAYVSGVPQSTLADHLHRMSSMSRKKTLPVTPGLDTSSDTSADSSSSSSNNNTPAGPAGSRENRR